MNKGLTWVVVGLALAVVVAALVFSSKVTKEAGRIFLSPSPISTSGSGAESAGAPSLVVSGNITLTISSPSDGSTVNSPEVTVSGKTTPNAEVFVNEKEIKADSSGSFFTKLTLDEGENTIAVIANDEQGNYIEKDITVNFVSFQ